MAQSWQCPTRRGDAGRDGRSLTSGRMTGRAITVNVMMRTLSKGRLLRTSASVK